MNARTHILKRLEAKERGVSIDIAIAKLLGWRKSLYMRDPQGLMDWVAPDGSTHTRPPNYSQSLDAALSLTSRPLGTICHALADVLGMTQRTLPMFTILVCYHAIKETATGDN